MEMTRGRMRGMAGTIVLILVCLLPAFSEAAMTAAEFKAYVDSINATAKKQQIKPANVVVPKPAAKPSPAKTATPTKPTTPAKTNAVRALTRGMRGNDVLALQQFLILQKLLSADSATGFFGPLTEAAVKTFQSQNGIVSGGTAATTGYGVVGPRTRAMMARLMVGGFAPASGPTPSGTSPTPASGGGSGSPGTAGGGPAVVPILPPSPPSPPTPLAPPGTAPCILDAGVLDNCAIQ